MTPEREELRHRLRFLARHLEYLVTEARAMGIEPDADLVTETEDLIVALAAELDAQYDISSLEVNDRSADAEEDSKPAC